LKSGVKVDAMNKEKNTALHYFCAKFNSPTECAEILELFVEGGANVNAQNSLGETPLHKVNHTEKNHKKAT
jgi:ankyrin repeat protein